MRSLEEAEKAGLILARRNRPGTFRFIHMLVAECLEEMMPSPASRRSCSARRGIRALSDAPTKTRQASIAYRHLRPGRSFHGRFHFLSRSRAPRQSEALTTSVFHLKQAVAALKESSGGAAELRAALIERGEAGNRSRHDGAVPFRRGIARAKCRRRPSFCSSGDRLRE